MASATVTTIEQLYAAFAARDVPKIIGLVDGGVEIRQTELLPWGGQYKGLLGLQSFFGKLTAAITSDVKVEHVIDAGDRVVVVGRTAGTVNANGAPFDVAIAHVWTLRGGKAVAFEAYIDTPAMLAALNQAKA